MAKKKAAKLGRKGTTTMREFAAGKLRSSSGGRVKSQKQALAIAFAQQRKADARRRKS